MLTWFLCRGHSGADVKFPRVLGIEAVGEVEEAPGGEFNKGDVVGTCMGGMGRNFDGKQLQYACTSGTLYSVSRKTSRKDTDSKNQVATPNTLASPPTKSK